MDTRRPIQQRSEETRARIMSAAGDLFARYGYDATGVAEICTVAAVSKGAFYHHFPSKQALFLALLEEWLSDVEVNLEIARSGAKDVPSALLKMAGRTGHVFQAADGRLSFFFEFWTQASRQPAVWQATIAPYRKYEKMIAEMIEDGIREGSLLPATDPQAAAKVIVGFAMGLLLQALFDPAGANWNEVMQRGILMLLEGMKRR